jgi:hypothetical protein
MEKILDFDSLDQNLLHWTVLNAKYAPLEMQNPLDFVGYGGSGSCMPLTGPPIFAKLADYRMEGLGAAQKGSFWPRSLTFSVAR